MLRLANVILGFESVLNDNNGAISDVHFPLSMSHMRARLCYFPRLRGHLGAQETLC